MIAKLRGVLSSLGKDFVVVDVKGIGFQVFVPASLLSTLDGPGQELTLYTHLHVRESELSLYGCPSEEELALFRLLLGVSGIGPKAALALLSSLTPGQLEAAIAQEDVAVLSRVPGIGPKTAKKLVFDLKDRVKAQLQPLERQPALTDADADLIAALTTLGYSVAEAQEALRSLPPEPLALEERVRLALSHLGM